MMNNFPCIIGLNSKFAHSKKGDTVTLVVCKSKCDFNVRYIFLFKQQQNIDLNDCLVSFLFTVKISLSHIRFTVIYIFLQRKVKQNKEKFQSNLSNRFFALFFFHTNRVIFEFFTKLFSVPCAQTTKKRNLLVEIVAQIKNKFPHTLRIECILHTVTMNHTVQLNCRILATKILFWMHRNENIRLYLYI